MSQSVGGATTNYVWDEQSANGDIVAETNASGAVQASYAVANGAVLAQTQAGATSYSLPDGQGSLRALTNASGAVTDSFRYDAFGNVLSHQGTTSSAYGYDSQRFDAASGLYALRARSYDPTTGRFLSRDPATGNTTDPLQLDRYVYASANPIMLSDPSGLAAAAETAQLGTLSAVISTVTAAVGAAIESTAGTVVIYIVVALTASVVSWAAWHRLTMTRSDVTAVSGTYNAATKYYEGQPVKVRPLTDKEVRDRGFHRPKGGKYGATDVIYEELDGNGNPTGEYWIGPRGSDNVTPFP